MEKDELLQLAARCEAASGPDLELDGAIWCAVRDLEFVKWDGAGAVWRDKGGIRHQDASEVPRVSASLDAALSLLGAGRLWSIGSRVKATGFVAVLDNDGRSFLGATPALALLNAFLRARAALA